MARRTGQTGRIERKGNKWHVRFYIDVPGQSKRPYKSIPLTTCSGPGKVMEQVESATQAKRIRIMASEAIQNSGANSEELFKKAYAYETGETFRQHAERWLAEMTADFKPATLANSRYLLERYLYPSFGDEFIGNVKFKMFKELVDRLKADKAPAAKTVHCIVQVGLQIIKSIVNDDGEMKYPQLWKTSQLRMPPVQNQHQPDIQPDAMQYLISNSSGQIQVLFALLAGTGLRIGECLGLTIEKLSDDASTVTVDQEWWRDRIQSPKTAAAYRQIDLHPSLAAMLKAFIGERKTGFLFATENGKPLSATNIARRHLHPLLAEFGAPKAGLHSFRRFRVTHLDTVAISRSLTDFWIGHAKRDVTDSYSKIANRVQYRKDAAQQAGLGFETPASCTQVPVLHPNSGIEIAA